MSQTYSCSVCYCEIKEKNVDWSVLALPESIYSLRFLNCLNWECAENVHGISILTGHSLTLPVVIVSKLLDAIARKNKIDDANEYNMETMSVPGWHAKDYDDAGTPDLLLLLHACLTKHSSLAPLISTFLYTDIFRNGAHKNP